MGKLSIASQPRSSSSRRAVVLPAPSMPVTSSTRWRGSGFGSGDLLAIWRDLRSSRWKGKGGRKLCQCGASACQNSAGPILRGRPAPGCLARVAPAGDCSPQWLRCLVDRYVLEPGASITTISATAASAVGRSTIPTFRISSLPAMFGGGLAHRTPSRFSNVTPSSPMRLAPRSISARARLDLPLPGGPSINKRTAVQGDAASLSDNDAHGVSAAGRATTKQAPEWPSGRLRKVMDPSCASTMVRAIARPRPLWPPNHSASGRTE